MVRWEVNNLFALGQISVSPDGWHSLSGLQLRLLSPFPKTITITPHESSEWYVYSVVQEWCVYSMVPVNSLVFSLLNVFD